MTHEEYKKLSRPAKILVKKALAYAWIKRELEGVGGLYSSRKGKKLSRRAKKYLPIAMSNVDDAISVTSEIIDEVMSASGLQLDF